MAKRQSASEKTLKKLLKALPAWAAVMIISIGILFAALIETGVIDPDDIMSKLDFPVSGGSSVDMSGVPDDARDFSVNVIDVGQGDSILILSHGKSMLIDAGEDEYSGRVIDFIRDSGIKRLDYVIATHPHSDHIGGMADVIREIGADKIILPKLPDRIVPTTRCYENFLNAVKDSGGKLTAAKAGNIYALGNASVTVLTPVTGAEYDDLNNYSVSVRVDYEEISWLFTGDLSKEGEADLLKSGADIDVTAYKAAHHGSSGANTEKFLKSITPRLCVISCGQDNSYGHPHDEALKRIGSQTISIYRTDILGSISVFSDGKKLYVTHSGNKREE